LSKLCHRIVKKGDCQMQTEYESAESTKGEGRAAMVELVFQTAVANSAMATLNTALVTFRRRDCRIYSCGPSFPAAQWAHGKRQVRDREGEHALDG
jgi:hypothetical protein